ncbi:MAG: HAD hydrolase family protein [Melioribacteraceae bacterium]|nr:HAD hydrolase family protein [Melioribacteraceae bacterium]
MKSKLTKKQLTKKASKIKFVLADVDGVLTDTGVYYSVNGEELKRYSIRDGMGVERLRTEANIETGILTRENTKIVSSRATKLKITDLHMGSLNKLQTFEEILKAKNLSPGEVAYIGDDIIDIEVLKIVGLSAAPKDALQIVKSSVDFICPNKGGNGAFRDLAELIIEAKQKTKKN